MRTCERQREFGAGLGGGAVSVRLREERSWGSDSHGHGRRTAGPAHAADGAPRGFPFPILKGTGDEAP